MLNEGNAETSDFTVVLSRNRFSNAFSGLNKGIRGSILLILLITAYNGHSKIWNVGPTRTHKFCSEVAGLVNDGDTVDIDSSVYFNDAQVTWIDNNLLIRGINGRPRLVAGDLISNDPTNGKGIFVIRGNDVRVENIEFRDAVVLSHNGAGIRQEGKNLLVRYCKFQGNEMGILSGNIPNCTITIEYSEFLQGGSSADPGFQHNIYINHIDSFIFRYNYSYDAIASGHELKSRATHNFILYNRIANINTIDSRNIDLPNGGFALVLGNVIEQGMNSSNTNLLGYGLEGLTNPGPHHLMVINNTFVNKKDRGSFIHVPASGMDSLSLINNIMAGVKTGGLIIGNPAALDSGNNFISDFLTEVGFVNAAISDYHLASDSKALNAGFLLSTERMGYPLKPWLQYFDHCSVEIRPEDGSIDIGAFERPSAMGMPEIKSDIPVFYPNPVSDELKIVVTDFPDKDGWYASDVSGKLWKLNVLQVEQEVYLFDVRSLPQGVYFIRHGENSRFQGKIIVQHE